MVGSVFGAFANDPIYDKAMRRLVPSTAARNQLRRMAAMYLLIRTISPCWIAAAEGGEHHAFHCPTCQSFTTPAMSALAKVLPSGVKATA